jgi:hypothetical protein
MKRLSMLNAVSPAVLVLVAFPVLFILAPDGIPFAHGCGSQATAGTITNFGYSGPRPCSSEGGDSIFLDSMSATREYSYCRIYVSGWVTINTNDEDGCDVYWEKWCGDTWCTDTLAAQGPVSSQFISTSAGCTNDQDVITINIKKDFSLCNCAITGSLFLYEAFGTCNAY